MNIIILTGMSGAGKTQVAHTLEDLEFFCIDNMPAVLISQFAEIYTKHPSSFNDVVFVVDVRGESSFDILINHIEALKEKGYSCLTMFIDCSKEVLINRYKETRRIHPLASSKGLTMSKAIDMEVEMLAPIKEKSDYLIDTSNLSIRQLHDKVVAIFKNEKKSTIAITCMSFGFKYGMAIEADLVFDVRCFPNPFYIPELKHLTGFDKAVRDYVFSVEQTNEFMEKLFDMVDFLLPLYIEEGKSQLTISIGCTGGRHRSVAIAERLNQHLIGKSYNSISIHRELD